MAAETRRTAVSSHTEALGGFAPGAVRNITIKKVH